MKILCVIDSLGSGGAQRQLVGLAMGFKEMGHEVSFLIYHNINFFKEYLDNACIPVICITEPNYMKRFFKMRRYIRNGNFDSVLSFLEAANFICELSGFPFRKWKLVVGERNANPNILKSFKLRIYRWFHLLADFVVANSEANVKMVNKINPFLSKNKCKVIYNMINLEKWKPSLEYVPRKDGILKIMVAASRTYRKNLQGLIEAINILSVEEKAQLKIEWYGDIHDNSFSEGLRKINEYNLSSIFNFFNATEVSKIMQQTDIIGLFSFYEGLPNVVCEGMSCGKPIISTKIADIPLILIEEENGFLCDPNDPTSIAISLKKAINSTNDVLFSIGKRNRNKAVELFTEQYIIKSYISLLNKE